MRLLRLLLPAIFANFAATVGMSSPADPDTARSQKSGYTIPVLFFLSPLLTAAVPQLTWLFLPLIAIALCISFWRGGGDWRQLLQPNLAVGAVLLVVLYVVISAIWAANRGAALEKGGLLLVMAVILLAAVRAVAVLDHAQSSRAAFAFAAGAFFGAMFILVELATDGAITRHAINLMSLLKPKSSKFVAISQGEVMEINPAQFRRSVTVLVSNFWPALLALSAVTPRPRRTMLIALLTLAVAVAVLLSERASSQVALLGSFVVFLFAWRFRRGAVRALAVLWCLAFVLVLPLVFAAYKAELHMMSWLPDSARARVILWEFTAERTLERPWLGIGAASTSKLRESRAVAEQPEGFIFPRNTGQHAHNLFLQSWYELGVVGALLMALAGLALLLRIPLLPWEAQPYAVATFAAFAGGITLAGGIWQTWLMGAVGLMLLYLQIAATARAPEPRLNS